MESLTLKYYKLCILYRLIEVNGTSMVGCNSEEELQRVLAAGPRPARLVLLRDQRPPHNAPPHNTFTHVSIYNLSYFTTLLLLYFNFGSSLNHL